ncbi:MAG TPA: aspartate kinase [Vicinamibacterales bacterium]
MRVLKFGGTSVADAAAIGRVAAIVESERQRAQSGPVVVVSALGGVTDRLLETAAIARRGDAARAGALVESLTERHLATFDELVPEDTTGAREAVVALFDQLRRITGALAVLHEASARSLDAIAAIGELASSRIVTAALAARGVPVVWADPRSLIVTDDSFTAAAPRLEETTRSVRDALGPAVEQRRVVVTGGFVAATAQGVTTTLGRGGSDYSAALIGAALDAEEIQIWTDVDGMLTADPRVVRDPSLVPFLSFAEAAELAYFGAKVLHPKTIQPAAAKNIPVRILNTFRPSAPGTLIADGNGGNGGGSVTALACKKGITVITITSTGMLMAYGYLRRLFEVFERYRTPVDVVSTSEVSVSVTIDDRTHLDAIVAGLSAFADVSVTHPLALVAVVGDGYAGEPEAFARVVRALEGLPLRLVSQAAARRNVTLVLDEADLPSAMTRLHAEFFGTAPAGRPGVLTGAAGER